MAKTNEVTDTVSTQSDKMTVEKLAELEKTPFYILAAVKAANGWGSGKELTFAEYKKAVNDFLSGSMVGRS